MNNYGYDHGYNAMQMGGSRTLAESSLIKNVYIWMTGALIITGLVAYYVSNSYEALSFIYGSKIVFWGLIIAEFGLVFGMGALINRISALTATVMFLLYSLINGALLSSIFMLYSIQSIGSTFLITAGTFGVMAVYGSVTKTDLSKIGNICFMGLIGIIIASVVNIFLKNNMMDLIISGVGVIIFTGLVAWDSQKIKAMLSQGYDDESSQKIAVLGALTLYLDFINLFIHLLHLMSKKK